MHVESIGRTVVLPSTFTGSPRYMHERFQDNMTYVRKFGAPDLFTTMTCNPRCSEIENELFEGQSPADRQDITARVFKQKVEKLMDLMDHKEIFGKVRCHAYAIEWQKRGLPHIHLLTWLYEKVRPDDIDKVISAELPDPEADPILYELVKKHMVHARTMWRTEHVFPVHGKRQVHMQKSIQETLPPKPRREKTVILFTCRRRSPDQGGKTAETKSGTHAPSTTDGLFPTTPFFFAHSNATSTSKSPIPSKASNTFANMYIKDKIWKSLACDRKTQLNDEITCFQAARYISTNEAVSMENMRISHSPSPPRCPKAARPLGKWPKGDL